MGKSDSSLFHCRRHGVACDLARDGAAVSLTKHAFRTRCMCGSLMWWACSRANLPPRRRIWAKRSSLARHSGVGDPVARLHLRAAGVRWSSRWKQHCWWDGRECGQGRTASACPSQPSMLRGKALPFGSVLICTLVVVPLRWQWPAK